MKFNINIHLYMKEKIILIFGEMLNRKFNKKLKNTIDDCSH